MARGSGIEYEVVGSLGKVFWAESNDEDVKVDGAAWVPSNELLESIVEVNEAKTRLCKSMTAYYDRLLKDLDKENNGSELQANKARDRAMALAGDILD